MADGKAAREARLAAALRENLKRRKAAVRPATDDEAREPSGDGADRETPAGDDGTNGRGTGGPGGKD